jgi:hypothetical protein
MEERKYLKSFSNSDSEFGTNDPSPVSNSNAASFDTEITDMALHRKSSAEVDAIWA